VLTPQAVAVPEYRNLTGSDRYQTCLLVYRAGFNPGVEAVVVVTGEDYPDALAAGPLAVSRRPCVGSVSR